MNKPSLTGYKERQIIPFPCHQNWEDLDLSESGNKHCSECDCEVRDLTDMSPNEIYSLQEKLGGKLCGKIYKKNNYMVNEIESNHSSSNDDHLIEKPFLTMPKIISGGIAALSLASCSSSEVIEQTPARTAAQPFPHDGDLKPVKETKQRQEPPCLLGIIALPPKD